MAAPPPPSVCVLGLGAMGSAIALRLRDAGHHVGVWNRSAPRTDALLQAATDRAGPAGVPVAGSLAPFSCPTSAVAASVQAAPVLCTLTNTAAVVGLLGAEGFGSSLGSRSLVNLASANPDDARRVRDTLAELAPESVPSFIDGAYCGPPAKARAGEGMLLLSAEARAVVDRASVVLSSLGAVEFCGPIGASRAVDYAVVDLYFACLLSYMSNKSALDAEGVRFEDVRELMRRRLDTVPAALQHADARMGGDRDDAAYLRDPTVTLETATEYWASRLPYLAARGVPAHLPRLFGDLLDGAAGGPGRPHGGADITRLQEMVRFGGGARGGGSTGGDE